MMDVKEEENILKKIAVRLFRGWWLVSEVAWELAETIEMLWKHSHSNVGRIGNRVVGGPVAICNTMHEGKIVGFALHAMVNYLHE